MADGTPGSDELSKVAELLKAIRGEKEKTLKVESALKDIADIDSYVEKLKTSLQLNEGSAAAKQLQLDIDTQQILKQSKILDLRRDAAILGDEQTRNLLVQSDILGTNKNIVSQMLENDRTNVDVLGKQVDKMNRIAAARQNSIDDMRTQNGLAAELTKKYDEIGQQLETGNYAGSILGAGDALNKTAGKAKQGFQNVTGVNVPGFLNQATQAALGLQDAIAKFNENFRFGDEYTDRIEQTYFALAEYGVSAQEAGEAQAALIKGVSDFTLMSKKQRDALTEQVALLNEIGVTAQTSAAIIQNSIKIMGTNVDETDNVLRRLTANAKELGFEQEEYMAAFATMGKDLAKLGSEGEMAFKKLAHASRITGMEMSRILTLTAAFDTFEGAAGQAGKLNAALGGNFVNAMDLMMATDPAERFGMIRDSILDTGLAFNDMSYYQRLFYVDALGLSDVGELAQVLSGNFDDLSGSVMASEETLLEQKNAAKAAKDVQESLNNAIAANAGLLTNGINTLSQYTQTLAQNPDKVKAVVTALGLYKGAMMATAAAQTAMAITGGGAAVGMGTFAVAVGAMAYGFNQLKDAMMIKSPSFIIMQLLFMIPVVKGLGQALNSAIPGMLAFGGAITLAGVGIMAASYGLSLLVPEFTKLFEVASPAQMLSLAASVGVLAASFIIMGSPLGLLAIAGVANLAAGMLALSFALKKLPGPETMGGLSIFTSNLLALTEVAGKLSNVANEIEKIGDAIRSVPNEKAIKMTAVLDKMQSTMLASATAPVNVATSIVRATTTPVAAAGGTGAPQVVVKQPIDIYLDKSKIGDFTMDIFADRVIGEIAKAR
jgi:hypothetical protein